MMLLKHSFFFECFNDFTMLFVHDGLAMALLRFDVGFPELFGSVLVDQLVGDPEPAPVGVLQTLSF
jgi:hypothetical protein